MKRRKTLLVLFLFAGVIAVRAQQQPGDITGTWATGGKEPAKILIYQSGDKFYGKIIWLKNPAENGKPRVDGNNPDPAKRNTPVTGLVILKNFRFNGDDEWRGGQIYDPENGKTYSAYLYLKNRNTLRIRGYIGVSLLGRTETWTRAD
jgi:uncharacterized protein (DUF2147 family)